MSRVRGRRGRLTAGIGVDLPHLAEGEAGEKEVTGDDDPGDADEVETNRDTNGVDSRESVGEASVEHEEASLEEPEDNGVAGPAAELDDGASDSGVNSQHICVK
jgi:hypothetical protein